MNAKEKLNSESDDAALVAESLTGNREAFEWIVRRYQSLVCALAYNATGSLTQSEDLAQDTFIAAWRQLSGLREPGKVRPWLCRIARNLAYDAVRKRSRQSGAGVESLEAAGNVAANDPTPPDHAISREEEAILWRSLAEIPEIYREPLVLFYREQQSVASVAAALELSEDAVKQRLSRGRKLLEERVLSFVEGAISRTGPSPAFTQAVLAALPIMSGTTAATGAGSGAVKAGVAKGLSGGLLNGLGAIFLIVFGNYAGYRVGLATAESEEARRNVKRFYRSLLLACVGFSALLALLIYWGVSGGRDHPAIFIALCAALGLGCVAFFGGLVVANWRRDRATAAIRAQREMAKPVWEYRSSVEFLGLPLVHIRIGGPSRGREAVVKAWFAAGGCAIGGIFAFGGMAIAPLSVGGFAVGILSWGGMAIGLAALGGVALGGWSIGGMAIGWNAFGACAIGWNAAMGSAALAWDFAAGSVAQAAHTGNAAADYLKSSQFFNFATVFSRYSAWLNVVWVLPLALWWKVASRQERNAGESLR